LETEHVAGNPALETDHVAGNPALETDHVAGNPEPCPCPAMFALFYLQLFNVYMSFFSPILA
jgi:hypothetical protein